MTQFLLENPWVSLVLYIWTIPWKGWALWRSAQKKNKLWFVAMLLLNTLGILEILYIFVISEEKRMEKFSKLFNKKSNTEK